MEILWQRGVRLIAINDGVDSANGENTVAHWKEAYRDNTGLLLFGDVGTVC